MPKFTRAAVCIRCQGEGLLLVETHFNIIERRCSIPARGIMDILPAVSFYTHIANMLAKAVSLPKHIIVALATNASLALYMDEATSLTQWMSSLHNTTQAYIRYVDTRKMTQPTEIGSLRPLQCQNIDSAVNSVHYKQAEWRKIQMDKHTKRTEQTVWKKTTGQTKYKCPTITWHTGPKSYQCCQNFNIYGMDIEVKSR